jgi:hypothetical protein
MVIIIIIAIAASKSKTEDNSSQISAISNLLKDPKACKTECKSICKSTDIISFTGDGRRNCKNECETNCSTGKTYK